jgi:hypothetical protein
MVLGMPDKLAKSGSVELLKPRVSSVRVVHKVYWMVLLSQMIMWKAAAETIDTSRAVVNGQGARTSGSSKGGAEGVSIEGAGLNEDVSPVTTCCTNDGCRVRPVPEVRKLDRMLEGEI